MKPIKTSYRGFKFRSRLEARWGIFFDKLGLRWEYEPQGYVLPGDIPYLPDFKLILPGDEIVYCEVNNGEADDFDPQETRKLRLFSNEIGCKVILLTSVPEYRAYNQVAPGLPSNSFQTVFFRDYEPYIGVVDEYWSQVLKLNSRTGRLEFDLDDRAVRKAFGRGFVEAVGAAKAATFEHGESP